MNIIYKTATYLSFLVRPFRRRALCPLKILLARHHFSKNDALEHAHIPQQSASCDCFSQYPKCPSVGVSSSYASCSYVSWSSEISPCFHSLSLSLNKRAVVFCFVWCTVDSFWQLMHWSSLYLLYSRLDNAVLYSLLSIHISSSAELQCKAAEPGFSVSVALGKKKRLCLSSSLLPGSCRKDFFFFFFWAALLGF